MDFVANPTQQSGTPNISVNINTTIETVADLMHDQEQGRDKEKIVVRVFGLSWLKFILFFLSSVCSKFVDILFESLFLGVVLFSGSGRCPMFESYYGKRLKAL